MAKPPRRPVPLSPSTPPRPRRSLTGSGLGLGLLFFFALFMGPGPGILLVNPTGERSVTFLGLPVIWLWAVVWFAIEASIVLIAFRWVWTRGDDQP